MYILNDGKQRHTFDWITSIDNIDDIKNSIEKGYVEIIKLLLTVATADLSRIRSDCCCSLM